MGIGRYLAVGTLSLASLANSAEGITRKYEDTNIGMLNDLKIQAGLEADRQYFRRLKFEMFMPLEIKVDINPELKPLIWPCLPCNSNGLSDASTSGISSNGPRTIWNEGVGSYTRNDLSEEPNGFSFTAERQAYAIGGTMVLGLTALGLVFYRTIRRE